MKSLSLILLIPLLSFSCRGNQHRDSLDGAAAGTSGMEDMGEALEDLTISVCTFGGEDGLKPVYFKHDSAQLSVDALNLLQRNAALLRDHPAAPVQIAGHSDERGTQEYNLALGQRRAEAVRNYLVQLGLPASRFVLLSYGEEVPAAEGHDEAAWQQNRRCEFTRAN